MARYVDRRWEPVHGASASRDRRGGTYRPYVPDPLVGRPLTVEAGLDARCASVEASVRALEASPVAVPSPLPPSRSPTAGDECTDSWSFDDRYSSLRRSPKIHDRPQVQNSSSRPISITRTRPHGVRAGTGTKIARNGYHKARSGCPPSRCPRYRS